MSTDASTAVSMRWPTPAAQARLHFVSGKGGTGKTTMAAALAIAFAAKGEKVLLVETEGRQAIAQLFDVPPLPPVDTLVESTGNGGSVSALAIDIEHALLEYLDMFYNLGFAGRAIKRVGAIDFVTTVAPGLRDVVLTGKIKERVIATAPDGGLLYDRIVVDSPPTGRIGAFLDVTAAMRDLAKSGPIRAQSEGVVKLLHSPETQVHLTTLLEAMPVQETVEAVEELRSKDLHVGVILLNRCSAHYLPDDQLDDIAEGQLDTARLRESLAAAGLETSEADLAGLVSETVDYARRLQAQQLAQAQLDEVEVPEIELPEIERSVDVGALYELAGVLKEAGV